MAIKNLTTKQTLFVKEYLKDLNATQAAIRAGYSKKTAGQQGERLLKKVEVSEAVDKAKQKRMKRLEVDADYVLRRLVEIDQMDLIDILNDDGSFKVVADWPKVWRQFVSGIDMSEIYEGGGDDRVIAGVLKKIKWPDKVKNLELLGKHVEVQAFKERIDHGGTVGHNIMPVPVCDSVDDWEKIAEQQQADLKKG